MTKISETRDYTKVLISGKHDGNSQVETAREIVYQKLSLSQTGALRRATMGAANETARQIAHNSNNFSQDKHTPSDPTSILVAQRFVSQECRKLALHLFCSRHTE